jgi:hypothetical protein
MSRQIAAGSGPGQLFPDHGLTRRAYFFGKTVGVM